MPLIPEVPRSEFLDAVDRALMASLRMGDPPAGYGWVLIRKAVREATYSARCSFDAGCPANLAGLEPCDPGVMSFAYMFDDEMGDVLDRLGYQWRSGPSYVGRFEVVA